MTPTLKETRHGLTILHFADGSTTITSSEVEAHIEPPKPRIVQAPHGNTKALRERYRAVHASLGVR